MQPLSPSLESLELHAFRAAAGPQHLTRLSNLTRLYLCRRANVPVAPAALCEVLRAAAALPRLTTLQGVRWLVDKKTDRSVEELCSELRRMRPGLEIADVTLLG